MNGRVMLARLVHPSKTAEPIDVTLFGTVTVRRAVQFANAYSSIFVTLLGIVTLLSDEQP